MYSFRRTRRASLFAFALSALAATAAQAEDVDTSRPYAAAGADSGADSGANASPSPTALSSEDRLSYTTAFDALRRGDLELARNSARQAKDRVLLGQVEFERLFHPSHVATYDELVGWLTTYSDLPMAERVYTLAMRRLPDGATPPPRPGGFLTRTWDSVTRAGQPATDPARAARVMLNNDDLQGAYDTGIALGDWWTSGLAAWRLQRYHDAYQAFLHVADDPTEDPWVRSAGAFWAARAAGFSGRQDRIQPLLRQAARWPATFYGQIAQRQLGEEMIIQNQPSEELAPVDTRALNSFVHQDLDARRTLALFEVGRRNAAAQSAREGLRRSRDTQARQMWADLYRMVAPSRSAERAASTVNAADYPMPELTPEGGYTVDQALVYALIRRESAFDANARSGAGAYGLMQVMPATAAYMTGDQSYVRQPQRLLNASHNMKVGQDYINRLLAIESFKGDLLKTVASYNAGPGPMLAAIRKLGADADPLLLIEIIDVPQAREYVEKVVAAYWIYQRMMGGKTQTLDAVVSGAAGVPLSLDYTPRPPIAVAPVLQTAHTETPEAAH